MSFGSMCAKYLGRVRCTPPPARAGRRLSHISSTFFHTGRAGSPAGNGPGSVRPTHAIRGAAPDGILQPIGNHEPRATEGQVILRHLVGYGLIEPDLRGLDFDGEFHTAVPIETGDVDAPVDLTDPNRMLEHHARQRPTGADEGVHDMLAHPFLGFELDPLLPDGTPDGPLALPTLHLRGASRQGQFRPTGSGIGSGGVVHPAKVQRPRPTLGHLEPQPDGEPHPSF